MPLLILAGCAGSQEREVAEVADALLGAEIVAVDADGPERKPYQGPDYFPPDLGVPTIGCSYGAPAKTLSPVLSEHERNWYSRHLAAAGEPSLYLAAQAERAPGAAILRFTWLRTFHPPVTIRVESASPDEHRLVAKQLSGAGGYDPGEVAKTVERPLSAEEADRLRSILERIRLFERRPEVCELGTDGAQWIFERADAGGYRFFSQWTPRKGPAYELGRMLMALTGWEFADIY